MFIHQWIKYIALTHPAMQNTKNFKYPVLYVTNFGNKFIEKLNVSHLPPPARLTMTDQSCNQGSICDRFNFSVNS